MENERGKLSVYIWGSGTRAKVSNIFTVQKATLSFPRVLTPSMCKAPDGKPFCKKNELIQLLKKKKKEAEFKCDTLQLRSKETIA